MGKKKAPKIDDYRGDDDFPRSYIKDSEAYEEDQKEQNTTTKGELLQPNFKTLHVGLDSPEDGERWQIINQDGEHILYIESYPLRENAIAICQAVNERQKLLDSNRELLDALKDAMDCPDMIAPGRFAYQIGELYAQKSDQMRSFKFYQRLQTAINNAKNIQP